MKKKIFIAALAIGSIALTGCLDNPSVNVPQECVFETTIDTSNAQRVDYEHVKSYRKNLMKKQDMTTGFALYGNMNVTTHVASANLTTEAETYSITKACGPTVMQESYGVTKGFGASIVNKMLYYVNVIENGVTVYLDTTGITSLPTGAGKYKATFTHVEENGSTNDLNDSIIWNGYLSSKNFQNYSNTIFQMLEQFNSHSIFLLDETDENKQVFEFVYDETTSIQETTETLHMKNTMVFDNGYMTESHTEQSINIDDTTSSIICNTKSESYNTPIELPTEGYEEINLETFVQNYLMAISIAGGAVSF